MKSFHLDSVSKREVIDTLIALLVGVGSFFALHYFQVTDTVGRVVALLAGAVFVGHLSRGHLCRGLRQEYPNARWIGLLAVGFAIATFGVIAQVLREYREASSRNKLGRVSRCQPAAQSQFVPTAQWLAALW